MSGASFQLEPESSFLCVFETDLQSIFQSSRLEADEQKVQIRTAALYIGKRYWSPSQGRCTQEMVKSSWY